MSLTEQIKELAQGLNEAYNPKSIVAALNTFWVHNYNADRVFVYIFDESTQTLRDFSKNWLIIENKKDEIYDIWQKLVSDKKPVLLKNNLFYPLKKYNKIIGFLSVEMKPDNAVIEFLDLIECMLSLKVQNVILSDKMQKNIDFHSSMKNIAKIIETQYETNYIIPIIGEMIDKFVAEHLVYIFLNDEDNDSMTLIWPKACNDEKILELVKVVQANSEFFTTENKKIGVFPMSAENKLIGTIVTKSVDTCLHEKEVEYIEQLANQAATTINRANVYAEILKHATLDALTGFYNRRQLEERTKQEVSSSKRTKKPLCAIMSDIDYFKSFNDNYGHAVGDYVLKTVAKVMKQQLRDYDVAGRYGGEEFVLLLPFTKISEAEMVANRLKEAVENTKLDISKINPEITENHVGVTISLGVSELKDSDSPEDLVQNADKALYEAKETGRNKVIVYGESLFKKV
ncbi:MAG: sensor domain-containing diguanylate cyclase [Clostridiaceae bacterium]|jgi:diguanylate cyclase (GGDEF)-like protein|nr:sensor domain-containing diguanylate cyclase [Clostridiaceae bacterium]